MGKVLTHREGFKLADFLIYCANRKWCAPEVEKGNIVFRFPRIIRDSQRLREFPKGTLKSSLTVKGKQIYKQMRHTLQVAGFNPHSTRMMFDTGTKETFVELHTDLFTICMLNN